MSGDAVAVVRRMLAAQGAGHIDEAIACTHHDVVVRPGFTVYRGLRRDAEGNETVIGRTRAEIVVRDGLVVEFDSYPVD